jgi:hypothetical protein
MAYSILTLFQSFFRANGPMQPDGLDLQRLLNIVVSSAASVVAHAGGGQASATPLTATYNEVDTVATAADSVQLPPAIPGTVVVAVNATTTSMQVFGVPQNVQNANAGDTIAAHNSAAQTATATGVAQAGASVGWYICTTLGQWKQTLLT